jgi:hypothetical protein
MLMAGPIIGLFGSEFAESVVLLRLLLPARPCRPRLRLRQRGAVHRLARRQLVVAVVVLVANVALNAASSPARRPCGRAHHRDDRGDRRRRAVPHAAPAMRADPAGALARRPARRRSRARRSAGVLLLDSPLLATTAFLAVFAVTALALGVVRPDELRRLLPRRARA